MTTRYQLDTASGLTQVLADGDHAYLYGLGRISQHTPTQTGYFLGDALGSLRRVADSNADILYERSYTPWGDVLLQSGALDPSLGYLGGWVDAAAGLIYVGNGQYYDPATGRFLTRDTQPGQLNPYTPGRGDPTSLLIGPLALLVLVRGRKKGRKATLFLVVLLALLVGGMTLTACTPGDGDGKDDITIPPTPIDMPDSTRMPTGTQGNTPTETQSPSLTPTPTATICPSPTAILGTDLGEFLITHYIMPLESDPFYDKGSDPSYDVGENPIYSPVSSSWADPYVNVKFFSETTEQTEYHRHIYDFVYNMPYGVAKQGTGITKDGQYISIDYKRSNIYGSVDEMTFVYKEGGSCGFHQEAWKTVASKDINLGCGDKVTIDAYPGIVFTVTDTGSQLRDVGQLDVFVGPMRWSDYYAKFPNGSDYIRSKVTKVGSP